MGGSTQMGSPNHPCDLHSRWRKMSFVLTDYDDEESLLSVIGDGPFRLFYNGQLRTVVDNFNIKEPEYANYVFDSMYPLCADPQEFLGGKLKIRLENNKCVTLENPIVNLDGYESSVPHVLDLSSQNVQPIDQWFVDEEESVFSLQASLFDNPAYAGICQDMPPILTEKDESVFG